MSEPTQSPVRYEYLTERIADRDRYDRLVPHGSADLDEYGKEGWKLVAVVGCYGIFIRELRE